MKHLCRIQVKDMPIPRKVETFSITNETSAQRGEPVQLYCNDLWHVKELENGLQY